MKERIVNKAYIDKEDNTYKIERAHNGMWVVMRYNARGKRKKYPALKPQSSRGELQSRFDLTAAYYKWDEVAV